MLASFVRQLRQEHSLTQQFVASKLGISRPTYLQIERGKRDLTIGEANTLAGLFDLSLTDFLAGKEPKLSVIIEKKSAKTPVKKGENLEIRVTRKNLEKFKQVLLYVLGKVGSQPNVGETVLHKLLYFIDFDYYEKFEENLMGATYIKNHHGPTSVALSSIIADMQKQAELEVVKSRYFTYQQKKYLPLKRPNLTLLSAREITHIDGVLARLSDKNATELEQYSHEDIPWQSAQDGQPLSYESVFYRDEKYSVRNYEDEL
ncbi:MAG: type II toxin-antitoxin system antitoxin SocA domain-containing protein [Patescibacteria group bacterium]|nr:DUF4065 domain-containing protein [Patescibacteria group bacterium]